MTPYHAQIIANTYPNHNMQLLESPIPPHTEIKIFIFAYGYFTVRLTVRGGGAPSALTGSKVEISQNPKN